MQFAIKTGCWFVDLPPGHMKIGISRAAPRRLAGYRTFRRLAPGPWFNSVSAEEYYHRYRTEILGNLNPAEVAATLIDLANGGIPVMMCYERVAPNQWCHRSIAALWLAEGIGQSIPEIGFETTPQANHPLMPPHLCQSA